MADIEVPHPGASDIVGRLLSDALSEHPDVQWLGLVSEDGFAIASEGAYSVDDDAVAAGAVRMMIQVRAMSKALGQSGTSQMFLEGSESGICVIDKDPWVVVVVGAPGVPIGLLRYEAREIAEAFPMGRRPALPAAEVSPPEPEEPMPSDWAVVTTGTFVAGEFEDLAADQAVAEDAVTEPDGEPEIRWADEPTLAEAFPEPAAAADIFGDAGLETVEELEMPSVGADDFSDWLNPEPAQDAMFDLAPDAPVTFEMPEPDAGGFDLPAPEAPVTFEMPEPDRRRVRPARSGGTGDLRDARTRRRRVRPACSGRTGDLRDARTRRRRVRPACS